jgi:hypothetical protein
MPKPWNAPRLSRGRINFPYAESLDSAGSLIAKKIVFLEISY